MGGLTSHAATDPNLLAGLGAADDAAVYRINDDNALVLTVDFFAPVVDAPYDYGYIAAANAMSDVYAVGGSPMLALNIACFPRSLDTATSREILRGGADAANLAGAIIVGGHTVEDDEPKYGLAVVGHVNPGHQIGHDGAQAGDMIVLTKPIGSGILTTAIKGAKAPDSQTQHAIHVMKQLNREASEAMQVADAHAATDITGYGLVGHLSNIAAASNLTLQISASEVPLMAGAPELAADGCISGGSMRNFEESADFVEWDEEIDELTRQVLCDAQTSGGLAIVMPPDRVDSLLNQLQRRQVSGTVIGTVTEKSSSLIEVIR